MAAPPPPQDPIAAAFRAHYGGPPTAQRELPPALRPPAGTGLLDELSAHRGDTHWHLATHGLAGPAGPAGAAPGHELTLLVLAADQPPEWAWALLLGAARTVRTAGRGLHPGARLAPGEPLDGEASGLVALGVREDPLVPAPPGGPALLQLVGITAGEHALMGRVGTALVLEKLAARDPLLRVDPARA